MMLISKGTRGLKPDISPRFSLILLKFPETCLLYYTLVHMCRIYKDDIHVFLFKYEARQKDSWKLGVMIDKCVDLDDCGGAQFNSGGHATRKDQNQKCISLSKCK